MKLALKELNLPKYKFRIVKNGDSLLIFDPLRKKELVLTPEEWVRQNLIRYLIEELAYPEGLISIEAGLKLNTLQKRYDALIYSREGKPLVLIECKAPEIAVNQSVFDQILSYNSQINAPCLLISNGMKHFFLKIKSDGKFRFEKKMPMYEDIL